MGDNAVKFICTLWIGAIAFVITRYVCAAVLCAGMLPDATTFQLALESLGPFLPTMSTICLLGGTAFAVMEVITAVMRYKKK